jgi:peptidyl-prolyl cis-trans isomerase D
MLEFFRTHTKLLLFVMVVLIIPSFVFFGIERYGRMNEGGGTTVANVGSIKISQAEWDAAHQRQIERMRQQMPTLDPRMLDSPALKRETLDALVRERVLLMAATEMHLAVSDERLQRLFATDPQYAFLRNPDNSVNKDILAAQNMSSDQFAAQYRQELATRQVFDGITGSVLAAAGPRKAAFDALLQRREVQVQRFETKDYLAQAEPSDAELATFYNEPANQAQFKLPEQAEIEYAVLDLEAIKRGISVNEEELRKYYAENASRYTSAEERRASHILVKADKDAPAAERSKAKAKAEALLAEVRKNPAAFNDTAKKNSDDPGSAERGGDLDFFGRGAMVKPFEDAAFAMKPGEISNLVESDFGYHIIRLDALRGGEKKPFEAVRAEIENEVKTQLAQTRYAEAAEQFTNTVYEQPDSLQPAIDKLKLTRQTATVLRTPAAGVEGALASPKLMEAVFASEAVRDKRNTAAIEVGPSQMAAAHVLKHTPERLPALDDVKDVVRERVVAQQAAALARKAGEARLAQVQQASDGAGLAAAVTVSRPQPQGLPAQVIDSVLRADAAKLPSNIGVDLGPEGYAVVRINKVLPSDEKAPELASLQPLYGQAWSAAEARAYYDALKTRLKVDVKVPAASGPL